MCGAFPISTSWCCRPARSTWHRTSRTEEVVLIGTKAMLAARPGLHPALVNLLVDAAEEIHSQQGYFEAAGEFPSVAPVDIPVSEDAIRHKRFGPSAIHRVLPFWVATYVERFVILVLPLIIVLVPVISYFPALSSLAGALACLPMVWPACAARARRRHAQGTASRREMAEGSRPHRARRRRHPDADQFRERGVYAARAHRLVRRAVLAKVAAQAPPTPDAAERSDPRGHRVNCSRSSVAPRATFRSSRCHEKSLRRRHRGAAGPAEGRDDDRRRRLRPVRHSREPHPGARRQRRQGPDHRRQQRRRRRLRHGPAAQDAAGARRSSPATSARTRSSSARCWPANWSCS